MNESRINGSAQKTDYIYRDSVNVDYMEINTPKSQLPEEPVKSQNEIMSQLNRDMISCTEQKEYQNLFMKESFQVNEANIDEGKLI